MHRVPVLAVSLSLAGLAACASVPADPRPEEPAPSPRIETRDDAGSAFADLVAADHWRKRNAARDRLLALGDAAFAITLEGTRDADGEVRATCHEVLRTNFPKEPDTITALIRGLDDENRGYVAYPAAFHLGEHRIEEARPALWKCVRDESTDDRTRFAAAKSLGELGDLEITVTLWTGLGSDDGYTRYLSNLGMLGLVDKDLTAFEYESPWEGAFVSGPAVSTMQGQPIVKAENRVARWTAIVAFTQWLKDERPDHFAQLEHGLW